VKARCYLCGEVEDAEAHIGSPQHLQALEIDNELRLRFFEGPAPAVQEETD
jgi:hypothetical protein